MILFGIIGSEGPFGIFSIMSDNIFLKLRDASAHVHNNENVFSWYINNMAEWSIARSYKEIR